MLVGEFLGKCGEMWGNGAKIGAKIGGKMW